MFILNTFKMIQYHALLLHYFILFHMLIKRNVDGSLMHIIDDTL